MNLRMLAFTSTYIQKMTIHHFCMSIKLLISTLGFVSSHALGNPKKKILWAAENNELDIVKELLEEDSSLVGSRDSDMYTPLHRACYNGHTDTVRVRQQFGWQYR